MTLFEVQGQSGIRRQTGLEVFAAETMLFITDVSPVSWVTMHLFDENGRRLWLGSRGIPAGFRAAYYDEQMWCIDPLANTRACGSERSLIGLQSAEMRCHSVQVTRYRSFLSSFGIRDAAELVFLHDDEPIGGMSLLWTDPAGSSLSKDQSLFTKLHRYIQISFGAALGSHLIGWRKGLIREFALTQREVQVVEAVCAGHSNHEIAQELSISLATVKTHLLHVFEKLQVPNRAALVRCVLQ
jgi:DNA-binding CsgD family transcriptional regulator